MFAYDSVFDLALGDSPFFPEKESLPVFDADTGPIAVDEGKNYFIKFYSGDIPGFFDTAPFYKRQFHGGVWELGFNNFVGLSRIGSLHIDIQNRKISNSLYTAMLDELADQYAALARILMHKTKKALYPQTAARESRFQTFDTHENRFIKFFLQELLWKIEDIATALDPDTSSYSQPFIPDIVVEKAGKKLIFDAKYKGIKGSGGFYGGDDQGSVWTWKPEDINKMHTYREAIKERFRYNNLTNQIIILYV